MKWLIKKIQDTWTPCYQVDQSVKLDKFSKLVSGPSTHYPKVVEKDFTDLQGNKGKRFVVIEDVDKKEAHEADQLIQKDLKKEADKVVTQFTDLLSEVNALEDEKVKSILLKMVKAIRYLVAEVK